MRMPLKFRADVYTKTVEYDEAGESIDTWTISRTIKCHFAPLRQEEKTVGRVANVRAYWLYTDDIDIEYDEQIRDVRDIYNNQLDPGSFNIIGIKRYPGWSKINYFQLNVQKVLD